MTFFVIMLVLLQLLYYSRKCVTVTENEGASDPDTTLSEVIEGSASMLSSNTQPSCSKFYGILSHSSIPTLYHPIGYVLPCKRMKALKEEGRKL